MYYGRCTNGGFIPSVQTPRCIMGDMENGEWVGKKIGIDWYIIEADLMY